MFGRINCILIKYTTVLECSQIIVKYKLSPFSVITRAKLSATATGSQRGRWHTPTKKRKTDRQIRQINFLTIKHWRLSRQFRNATSGVRECHRAINNCFQFCLIRFRIVNCKFIYKISIHFIHLYSLRYFNSIRILTRKRVKSQNHPRTTTNDSPVYTILVLYESQPDESDKNYIVKLYVHHSQFKNAHT